MHVITIERHSMRVSGINDNISWMFYANVDLKALQEKDDENCIDHRMSLSCHCLYDARVKEKHKKRITAHAGL